LMSPEELFAGFRGTYKQTFQLRSIFKRMRGVSINTLVNLVCNLAYRIFVHRLYNEERFQKHCHPHSQTAAGVSAGCQA
jgi:hypothetical protein